MATTTNYSWTTPDDTALVKDGAAAIRSLGTSVDTTTKNLNPSTTLGDIEYRSSTANVNTRLPLGTAGQVLKVNSGATAPEWATDATGMTNPMTTTGDTIYSSSGSTPARLAIGSTGNVLTVAGGVPTWAAPAAGGGMTLLSTTNLSGTSTTTISSISQDYKSLHIIFSQIACSSGGWTMTVKPNNTTTISQMGFRGTTGYSSASGAGIKMQNGGYTSSGNDAFTMTLKFDDYTSAIGDTCPFQFYGRFYDDSDTTLKGSIGGGGFTGNTAITSLTIETDAGTFNSNAKVSIYGVN
jgi:hypothetical protein